MTAASILRSPEHLFRVARDAAFEVGAAADVLARSLATLSSESFSHRPDALVFDHADQPTARPLTGGPRVLFVHGMLGNHSWSAPLERSLAAAGGQSLSLDYRTVGTDLEQAAACIARAIDAAVPAGRQVHVVAHSLGGLVVRAAAAEHGLGSRFASVTTLATPHQGTPMALRPAMQLPRIGRLIRDLHPGSRALVALADAEATQATRSRGRRCRWTALYSADDELVPGTCGRLESPVLGAQNLALEGLGHFSITTSHEVHRLVGDVVHEAEVGRRTRRRPARLTAAA